MRGVAFLIAALALTTAAKADEIVLPVDPYPVVDAVINDQPVRLLVDPVLTEIAVLDPEPARRVGVRPIPTLAVRVALDDASIRSEVARPVIRFANGKSNRVFTGLFRARWADVPGVDGAIGPGVLPYDTVRFVLRDGEGGATRAYPTPRSDVLRVAVPVGGEPGMARFNFLRRQSVLSRPTATLLDDLDLLTPEGAVRSTPFFLGLSTTTQPARVNLSVLGFDPGETLARTNAPLTGPDGVDVVPVIAGAAPAHVVELGRDALDGCFEIAWARTARTLSLRCDAP